jgi:UDP-glucose 4-epimerase
LLAEAARAFEIDCISVRIPLVYGPRVKANFLKLLQLSSAPLPLPFGSLSAERSLAYIGSLVEFLDYLCTPSLRILSGSLIFSDLRPISVSSIFRVLRHAMGIEMGMLSCPQPALSCIMRLAGMHSEARPSPLLTSFRLDPSRDFDRIGWLPSVDTYRGLELTASWFVNRHSKVS